MPKLTKKAIRSGWTDPNYRKASRLKIIKSLILVKETFILLELPGISRDKTMADKLTYIPNENTLNYSFCRLQLVVEPFGHSTK